MFCVVVIVCLDWMSWWDSSRLRVSRSLVFLSGFDGATVSFLLGSVCCRCGSSS